jgi:hypothetical protein
MDKILFPTSSKRTQNSKEDEVYCHFILAACIGRYSC